jgi:hypothetical protein
LSDGQSLLFNSGIINRDGFSPGSHSDLWSVSLEGTVTERLAAGRGEPRFFLSPQGRVLLSGAEEVLRVAADGSALESVLTFPAVNLVEALYYPDVQWVAGGERAYAAVSGPIDTALQSEAEATLWRIPAAGPAEPIGSVETNVIASPLRWSDDGNRLAYVRRDFTATRQELIIADADGSNSGIYLNGAQLSFLGWSPNDEVFVFGSPEGYAVGRLGAAAVNFPIVGGQTAVQVEWLNDSTFIAAASGTGSSSLISNNTTGQSVVVASFGRLSAPFDMWTP